MKIFPILKRKIAFSLLSFLHHLSSSFGNYHLCLLSTNSNSYFRIDVTQIPAPLLPIPHFCLLEIKALNILTTFSCIYNHTFKMEGRGSHLGVILPSRGHLPTSGDVCDCYHWGRSMPFTG